MRSAITAEAALEPSAATRAPAPEGPRRRSMPRAVRVIATALAFGLFFASSALVGLVVGAFARLRAVTPDRRARLTRRLNRTWAIFLGLLRDVGLIRWLPTPPPPGVRGAVLVVANHPTLLDVAVVLASMPELVCVVKRAWYRTPVLGPMLRATDLIPGPDPRDVAPELAPVAARIAARLREGRPVLVFPEGTRSPRGGLRRLRRGAIHAAVQAGAPILPLVLHVDRPFLSKGSRLADVPDDAARYAMEWLPAIPTEGRDARELVRELTDLYRRRLSIAATEERR